jgi:hypothetical protein
MSACFSWITSIHANQTRISLLIIKSRNISNGKIGHFLAYLFADSIPFPYDIPCLKKERKFTRPNSRKANPWFDLQKIYIYFIEITFLSQFCLFNTLFQVYPTTARMNNFSGLVKRHLAGIFCGYRLLTAWF